MWARAYNAVDVSIVKSTTGNARFDGLQTCGSVWHCPICSAKISEVRRQELNEALSWARNHTTAEIEPVMLTLTFRHQLGDDLPALLDAMKRAKQKLFQSRVWRGSKNTRAVKDAVVGTVTATEVTHGQNGWHPHLHILVLVDLNELPDSATPEEGTYATREIERLRDEWHRSLAKVGLNGNEAAFQVQTADAAGSYFGKWGAAEELALSDRKSGGGRHPFQILGDAADGCEKSAALFVEYALTFKRRRQLVWSDGLKKLIGLNEVSDEEAAEDEQLPEEAEVIYRFDSEEWQWLRRKRIDRLAVLRAADQGGTAEVRRLVNSWIGLSDPGRPPGRPPDPP